MSWHNSEERAFQEVCRAIQRTTKAQCTLYKIPFRTEDPFGFGYGLSWIHHDRKYHVEVDSKYLGPSRELDLIVEMEKEIRIQYPELFL